MYTPDYGLSLWGFGIAGAVVGPSIIAVLGVASWAIGSAISAAVSLIA